MTNSPTCISWARWIY